MPSVPAAGQARGAGPFLSGDRKKRRHLAWYHPDDVAPTFDVIDYPEFTDAEWAAPIKREWRFASNPQEIAENGVDVAHFAYVHAMDAVPEGETDYEGVRRRSVARGHRTIDLPSGERKQLPYSVETIQNGAGQKFTRLSGLVELSLLVIATPVEADDVELRFCFTHPKVAPGSPEEKAIERRSRIPVGKRASRAIFRSGTTRSTVPGPISAMATVRSCVSAAISSNFMPMAPTETASSKPPNRRSALAENHHCQLAAPWAP